MKNCKFCCDNARSIFNSQLLLSWKNNYMKPGIEVAIEDGELYICAIADTYEPSFQEEYILINFCPMCGRKF